MATVIRTELPDSMELKMRKLLVAALVLLAASGAAKAEKIYHIKNDPGGNISSHVNFYQQIASKYNRIEIDGLCQSACTVVLGIVPLNRICVTPNGVLSFHAAHTRQFTVNARLTASMSAYYPPPVMSWVNTHHALDDVNFSWLRGSHVPFLKHCKATPASSSEPRPPVLGGDSWKRALKVRKIY